MPAISNHRTDPETSNGIETIQTDLDNQWIKDDLASILSGSNHSKSKPASLARLNVEILRANSPTLKRLAAVRNKLDKYVNSLPQAIEVTRQSIHETSHSSKREKQAPINVRTAAQKASVSTTNLDTGPLDKITYEKTRSHNGSVKKKCSLEIWLPKAGSDDEDNENTHRTTSPDPNLIEKKSQSPQITTIKSRLSNPIKIPKNIETKSLDEPSPKRSEPIIVPRVYRYEDYLTDQPEERPRSGKSGGTNKSDGDASNKSSKRQRLRAHTRRHPVGTNKNEQIVQPGTTILPMTSKNLLANIKQTNPGYETRASIGSSNSSMINELIKKYSMIKKSHQELTQAKLQLEKPHHDSKNNLHMFKDNALPSPPASDTASFSSSDHPTMTVRKLLVDTSPPRSAVDHNRKLLDRRSAHHKASYSNSRPQARVFSLFHHLQYRQTSASMSTALLPAVVGKKNDDPFRSFQRSEALDVAVDVSNDSASSIEIPSRLPHRLDDSPETVSSASNLFQRITNGIEPTSAYISKRSLPPPPPLTLRPERQQIERPAVQLVQYQNVQNSAQRYHHHSAHSSTTAIPTKKVLVHLKYSSGRNADHKCLVPE